MSVLLERSGRKTLLSDHNLNTFVVLFGAVQAK